MFNISALLKLINVNNDDVITKEEVQAFQGTQKSPSIFCGYFDTMTGNVDLPTFSSNLSKICSQNEGTVELNFKDEKTEQKYENLVELESFRNEFKKHLSWKTGGVENFDKMFDQLVKENNGNIDAIYSQIANIKPVYPITIQTFRESGVHSIQLPYETISSDIDWSNSREIFKYLAFNDKSFSQTPPEHLPEGYDPKQVMENGKTIGLGIDNVHAQGYTGKGVSFAMIDSGIPKHNDIYFKEYNVSQYANPDCLEHFHGGAVRYIAQEIAPDADCYYYATHNGNNMEQPVVDNLKAILEKNKSLPNDNKIRFVSMSMPLYGDEEARQVVKELEAQGCWVFYSGDNPDKDIFAYLNKKDPMGDPNDFNNYEMCFDNTENALHVNSGDRSVPDTNSETAYRHDSCASRSWSIPVVAGYYTLACQADPTMTKAKFIELADKTARIVSSTKPILEETGEEANYEVGRTEETYNIKIIDIEALLKEIENSKQG